MVVTVGGNTTSDAGAVFQPQSVIAAQGDVVLFNCKFSLSPRKTCLTIIALLSVTQGNHTVIQSDFASPCVPLHISNVTLNGFDSSFRDAGNFSAITQLSVPIDNPNQTVWFFDWNTCAEGGVGGINVNESSYQTLDGFEARSFFFGVRI